MSPLHALASAVSEPAPSSNGTDLGSVVAFLSALAALVSVAITSLRKRKDVSVTEMQARIDHLESENATLNEDLVMAQTLSHARGRDLFVVRTILADHGLTDPTVKED